MRPGDVVVSARKTLFRTLDDFKQCYSILISLLTRPEIGLSGTQADDLGQYEVGAVLTALHEEDTSLGNITRDHLVEAFLKDPLKKITYDGKHMGHTGGGLAVPPSRLYYATTGRIAERIRVRGLQSPTKPYIPLMASSEDACRKCSWFVSRNGDDMALVTIDSEQAYKDHVDFSYAGKGGEFLVERLSSRYILEIKNLGPVPEGGVQNGNYDNGDFED